MRLRGTKTELEEAGLETDNMAESTSQLQKKLLALTHGEVDIMLDANTFKSTTQILREMSGAWSDMNDMERASALELMGGKRQANVLSALIKNFNTVEDAIESSANAAGSARRENEKYLDSIQGRIDLFNNSVQTMWKNTLDDQVVKDVVNLGTKLVKIVDEIGLVKVAFMGLGVFLMKKYNIGDIFNNGNQSLEQMRKNLNILREDAAKAEIKNSKWGTKLSARKKNKATKRVVDYEEKIRPFEELNALQEKQNYLLAQQKDARAAVNAAYHDYNQLAQKDPDSFKLDDLNNKIKMQEQNLAAVNAQINANTLEMQKLGVATNNTGNQGLTMGMKFKLGFRKVGLALKTLGKQLLTLGAQMLAMYAITTVIDLIGKGYKWIKQQVDGLIETAEEAQEKFDELNNELAKTNSELRNLESELDTVNDRIDELMSQGSLSFTDKEELARLREQSAELERQIGLQKTLQENLQKQTNEAAKHASDRYLNETSFGSKESKTERQEKAKETGKTWGGLAGALVGGIAAGIIGIATGGIGLVPALALVGGGAALGQGVGGLAGESIEGSKYDKEQSVDDAVKNMRAQRAELKRQQDGALASGDTKAYNEATEALQNYDSQMAEHMSRIQEYYNSMDWELATTEQRQAMKEQADILDAYNIEMGGKDAKKNAIDRVFGEEADETLKAVKKKFEDADGSISLEDAFEGNEEAYNQFVQRMYDMGIYITDVENYYKDLALEEKNALENVSTYGAVKEIANLTGGVNALKNAFKELKDEGMVSADTLVGLEQIFGKSGDAWTNFVNIMSSGTATMGEAKKAAEELAESYINNIISSGKYDPKEYLTYIAHLQQLGVKNAREFLDSKIVNNAITAGMGDGKSIEGLSDEAATKKIIENSKKLYGDLLTNEKYKTAIEKAIAAERAKQQAEKTQTAKNEYDAKNDEKKNKQQDLDVAKKELEEAKARKSERYVSKSTMVQVAPGVWQSVATEWSYRQSWEDKQAVKDAEAKVDRIQGELDAIEIPAKVDQIDVDNANKLKDDAQNKLDSELDNLGLKVKLELINPSELVDDIQSVYDALANAQKEYNENGYLSVDTMQTLLNDVSPKYLTMLTDENGQLNLNKDTLYKIAQARIEEMKLKAQNNILSEAERLASGGTIEALNGQITAMAETGDAYEILAEKRLNDIRLALEQRQANGELVDFDIDAYIAGLRNQLDTVGKIADSAKDNIENSLSGSGNTAKTEADDAFQKAMKYWENLISANQAKYEQVQNEIDLLEKKGITVGRKYYDEQILLENQRKELLLRQKEQAEELMKAFTEGSDEWFLSKPAYWETYKRNPFELLELP